MKTYLLSLASIGVLSLVFACNKTTTTALATTEADTAQTTPAIIPQKATPVEGDNVFVINAEGASLYETPSTNHTAIGSLPHGLPVQISKITENFAIVNAYIHQSIQKNGKTINQGNWRDVYTPITNLGNRSELQILPQFLFKATASNDQKSGTHKTKTSILQQYLTIELITAKTFQEALKNKTDDFLDNSPIAKKENNTITISDGKYHFSLQDNTNDESNSFSINTYIGFIPFLDAYLINQAQHAGEIYHLYDKATSKSTNAFYGFPYISPTKKHLIALDYNNREAATEIAIYNISNGKINPLEGKKDQLIGFSPYYNKDEKNPMRFWSSDNAYYIKVVHPTLAIDRSETYKNPIVPQYLKISFK